MRACVVLEVVPEGAPPLCGTPLRLFQIKHFGVAFHFDCTYTYTLNLFLEDISWAQWEI